MEEEKRKAYSEVVEILKLIDDEEKLEKLPIEVVELIKSNSDPTYKPEISKEIPLEDQNLRNETYAILGWISSKYWAEQINEQEKIEEETEKKVEEKPRIMNAAVYNDLDRETLEKVEEIEKEDINNLPVLLSDIKWYERVKQQIIEFFKKIFKISKRNVQESENQ